MLKTRKRSFSPSAAQRICDGIFDYLSCVLLSLGVLFALNSQFPIRMSVPFILSAVLMFLAVMFFITVNPMIFAAASGVIGIFLSLYITLSVKWSVFFRDVSGIAGWWFAGMDPDGEFYSAKGFDAVFFTVTLGIALIAFITVKVIKKSAVPTVAFGLSTVILCALSDRKSCNISLLFYLAGALSLICRDHFFGKRIFSSRNKRRVLGSQVLFCAVSLILSSAIALSAVLGMPENMLRHHKRGAADKVADFQSKTGIYTAPQKEFKTATLHELGLSPDESRIGGNLEPAEDYAIAEVITDTDRPMLFKTAVFDEFNGSRWTSSESRAYRIDGKYKNKSENYFYSKAFKENNSGSEFKTHKMKVKLLSPQNGLYTADKAENFKELTKTENPLLFNEHSEIFSFFGENEGYEYSFDTRIFPAAECGNAEKESIELINSVSNGYDDKLYTDDFVRHYTKLPKYWSKTLLEYALTVKNEGLSNYETVLDFCALLSPYNDFTYSESPGDIKESVSPCDQILINKSGYSTLYATALCLMARACNIPSRLAAGYKSTPLGGGNHTLENRGRYAWAECYFKGIGWISFDPFAGADTASGKTNIGFKRLDSQQIKEAEKSYTEFLDSDTLPDENNNGNKKISLLSFFAVSLGGLILFIVFLMLLKFYLAKRFFDEQRIEKRYSLNSAKAVFYISDIKTMLETLINKKNNALTLSELSCLAGNEELKELCAPAAKIFDSVLYGEKEPQNSDIEKIKEIRAQLEKRLKLNFGGARYFKERILLANFTCKKADDIEKSNKK